MHKQFACSTGVGAALLISQDPDALLNEHQVAEFCGLSVRTLQSWRLKGEGIRWVRCGRAVRYRRRDIIDWMEKNTVSSTSDPGRVE
jgi:predicted DNA-binding transcriptional regulator AlpA